MDSEKWHNVLVEWVNCLKLCKNVHSVLDLRNGEFFLNLQKVVTKNHDSSCDILTFIFNLLAKHYPNYVIANTAEVHLEDLPEEDLKCITSLLMHYTCIYDRKDVLTSPMCHSLSQSTQLIIRNFLQKLTKDVTTAGMDTIIKSCVDDASDHFAHQWLALPPVRGSPLQDLLRTPVAKIGRLQEKDKLIAKLQADLEVERFEKADLQEELKLHAEQNRKIQQQLQERNADLTRLRGQVLYMETPPHGQDMDSRDLERRLRLEIQNLEEYVSRLQQEQDQLQREKEAARERAHQLESQASIWERKFFESDCNLDLLTDHSKHLEEELAGLREHCSELTAMLEEYRAKPANDSSLFESYSRGVLNETPSSGEDLACAVVEVQLRDAQKQNEELTEQIAQLHSVTEELRREVATVQEELRRSRGRSECLESQLGRLEEEKKAVQGELCHNVQVLTEATRTCEELQGLKEELLTKLQRMAKDLEDLTAKLDSVEADKGDLQSQLVEAVHNLERKEAEAEELATQLGQAQALSETLKTDLESVSSCLDEARTGLVKVQTEKEEFVIRLQQTEEARVAVQTKLDHVQRYNKKMEQDLALTKEENSTLSSTLRDVQSELSSRQELVEKLQAQLDEVNFTNTNLGQELTGIKLKLQEEVSKLLSKLQESEEVCLVWKTKGEELIHTKANLEEKVEELKKVHTRSEEELKELTELAETLRNQLSTLQTESGRMGEELVATKEEKSVLLLKLGETSESLEEARRLMESMKENQAHLEAELHKNESLVEELRSELEQVNEEKDDLSKQFGESEENWSRERSDLYSKLKQLEEKFGGLCLENRSLESEVGNLEKQMQELKKDKSYLEERLQQDGAQVNQLTYELEQVTRDKEDLAMKLEDSEKRSSTERLNLLSKVHDLEEKCGDLFTENHSLQTEVEDFEKRTLELAKDNSGLEKQLLETYAETEDIRQQLQMLQSEEEELYRQLTDTKSELGVKEQKLVEAENLLSNLVRENEDMMTENLKLKQHLEEKEIASETLKKQLQAVKGDFELITKQLEQFAEVKVDLQNRLTDVELNLRQIDELREFRRELETQLQEVQEGRNVLVSEVHGLEKKNEEMSQQTRSLQKQLSDTIQDLEVERKVNCVLKTEIEELVSEVETLRIDKEATSGALDEVRDQARKLVEEQEQMQNQLQQSKTKEGDLEKKNGNLLDEIAKLQTRLSDMINDSKFIKKESMELKESKNSLKTQLHQLQQTSQEHKNEIDNLHLEKIQIGMQLMETQQMSLQLEQQKKAVEDQNQHLQSHNQILQKQVNDITNSLNAKKEELKQLQNSLQVLESQSGQMKIDIETLRLDLAEKTKECSMLEEEKMALLSTVQESDLEVQNLQKQLSNTQMQGGELRSTLAARETFLEKMEVEKKELLQNLQESQDRYRLADKKNEELQSSVEALERQLEEVRVASDKMGEELRSYVEEGRNTVEQLVEARQSLHQLTEEKETLLEQLQQSNERCDNLDRKLTEMLLTLELQSGDVDKVRVLEETVQDYEITISGLKSVIDSNLESMEMLKEEKARLTDELFNLKNKEKEIMALVVKNLQEYGLDCYYEDDLDLREFVLEQVAKLLHAKKEEEDLKLTYQNENLLLREEGDKKSSIFREKMDKLQMVVWGQILIASPSESDLDKVCQNLEELLQAKDLLSQNLEQVQIDKEEIAKQLEMHQVENDQLQTVNNKLEQCLQEEQDKCKNLSKELDMLNKAKNIKVEKENVLGVSTRANKSREEELKKENSMLKKKLLLTEHSRGNLEKALKELREEKKRKTKEEDPSYSDALYKKLLQEYIQIKEEHEQVIKEKDAKYQELLQSRTPLIKNEEEEEERKLLQDLHNIREAYGNVMSVNSKLELEVVTLRKLLEERNNELGGFAHVKEAYERLLEENNKLLMEMDTVKYKRTRDKEEFFRLLKKEREETFDKETKRIHDIRLEYEGKLERMKEKMLKLYREEVNKKMKSVREGENATLLKTISGLRGELMEAEHKVHMLEMEKEILKTNRRMESETTKILSSVTTTSVTTTKSEERAATLPRPMVTEEVVVSRRTSVGGIPNSIDHNLQMEDEEDMFNDKCLSDLKEGRCPVPGYRESNVSRYSELAWRNSLVPPHLKSSYPAEVQFVSPTRFKEEDLKTGNIVELDDSLCKLLPGEKPRKKDFGTTSYKKPGPPTPSKNGGRLSLQGNEVHPLRDHCEAKTPKKSTPSRIKALFTGRNSSTRENSEVGQNTTPVRGKRLSIFRRPK